MKGFAPKTYQAITLPVDLEGAISPVLVAELDDGYWIDIDSGARAVESSPDTLREWSKCHTEIRQIQCIETGRQFDAIPLLEYSTWIYQLGLNGSTHSSQIVTSANTETEQIREMVAAAESEGRNYIKFGDVKVRFYRTDGNSEPVLNGDDVAAMMRSLAD